MSFGVIGLMGLYGDSYKNMRPMAAVLACQSCRELLKVIHRATEHKNKGVAKRWRKLKGALQIVMVFVCWSVGKIAFDSGIDQNKNDLLDNSEVVLCYVVAVLEALIICPICFGAK